MFSWLLVNIVLTLLALSFIALNASAPHRLRFLISFGALLAWSIPWQLVPEFMPQWQTFDLRQLERSFVENTAEYSLQPIVIATTGLPLARDFLAFTWLQLGFTALCTIGLLLFAWHAGHHYLVLRQLRRSGEDGAPVLAARGLSSPAPVIIQSEIAGAFSSGLLAPRIWIHRELVGSNRLATLLRHELTHIRQHDNWYLLVITFIEKLFWWNPLVWLLGRQARELQELSCDALCQQASADYPLHLAELMIDSARLNPAAGGLLLSANIFNKTSLNIKRIKLLQRSYAMKARHFVSTVVTALGAIATIGVVTAQPEAGEGPRVFIRSQTSAAATNGEAGDVVFIARDHGRPLTEEEVAALADTQMFIEGEMVAGTPGMRVMGWNAAAQGSTNQFIRINADGDKLDVSFDFTDAPLQMVLEPLANMAAGGVPPAFGFGVAGPAPGAAGTTQVFRQQIVEGSITTAPAVAATSGGVVIFHTQALPPGAEPFNVPVAGARLATAPFTSKLVIEDEADRERLVTAQADNVSIDEALEIIGAEANCNIFIESDEIVVNSCAN